MKFYLFLLSVLLILVSFAKSKNATDVAKCADPVISQCKCGNQETLQEVYVESCHNHEKDSCEPCPGACEVFTHCHTCSKKECSTCPIGMTGQFCDYSIELIENKSLINATLLSLRNGSVNLDHGQENVSAISDDMTTMSPRTEIDPELDINSNLSSIWKYKAIQRESVMPKEWTPVVEYSNDKISESDEDSMYMSEADGYFDRKDEEKLKEVATHTAVDNATREENKTSFSAELVDRNFKVENILDKTFLYPYFGMEENPQLQRGSSFFDPFSISKDSIEGLKATYALDRLLEASQDTAAKEKQEIKPSPSKSDIVPDGSYEQDSVIYETIDKYDENSEHIFSSKEEKNDEKSKLNDKHKKTDNTSSEKSVENAHLQAEANSTAEVREFLEKTIKEAVTTVAKKFEGKLPSDIMSTLVSVTVQKNGEDEPLEKLKPKGSFDKKNNSTYYVLKRLSAISPHNTPCDFLGCGMANKKLPEHTGKDNRDYYTHVHPSDHHQHSPNRQHHKMLHHNGVHYKSPDHGWYVHKSSHNGMFNPQMSSPLHEKYENNHNHGSNYNYKSYPQTIPSSYFMYYNIYQPDYADYSPYESYPNLFSYNNFYRNYQPVNPSYSPDYLHNSPMSSYFPAGANSMYYPILQNLETFYKNRQLPDRAPFEIQFEGDFDELKYVRNNENSSLPDKSIEPNESNFTTSGDKIRNIHQMAETIDKGNVNQNEWSVNNDSKTHKRVLKHQPLLLHRNRPSVGIEKESNPKNSRHNPPDYESSMIAEHFSDINAPRASAKKQKKCNSTRDSCAKGPHSRKRINAEKSFQKANHNDKGFSKRKPAGDSDKARITAKKFDDKREYRGQAASKQSGYYSSSDSDGEFEEIKSEEEAELKHGEANPDKVSESEVDADGQDEYRYWNLNVTEDEFPAGKGSKSDDEHLFRLKRRVSAIDTVMASRWCPIHKDQTFHGDIDCTIWSYQKICTLKCHRGYSAPLGPYKCSARTNVFVPTLKPCVQRGI